MKEEQKSNGFGITSLVLGLVGLVIFPLLMGPLAIIFGGIGMAKKQKYSVAGLILGIFDVIIGILIASLLIALIGSLF